MLGGLLRSSKAEIKTQEMRKSIRLIHSKDGCVRIYSGTIISLVMGMPGSTALGSGVLPSSSPLFKSEKQGVFVCLLIVHSHLSLKES